MASWVRNGGKTFTNDTKRCFQQKMQYGLMQSKMNGVQLQTSNKFMTTFTQKWSKSEL